MLNAQEKNLTKKLVGSNKALEKAEDADGRGILLYPDTVKKATWYESGSKKNEKKKEKLRQLATAEKDLYEALFDALDYSGAPPAKLQYSLAGAVGLSAY